MRAHILLHVALVVVMMGVLAAMIERGLTLSEEASRRLVRLGTALTVAYRVDRGLIFRVDSVCGLIGRAKME